MSHKPDILIHFPSDENEAKRQWYIGLEPARSDICEVISNCAHARGIKYHKDNNIIWLINHFNIAFDSNDLYESLVSKGLEIEV